MYARMAQYAKENRDAFMKQQLVALYMEKQDKKLQKMAHLYIIAI